MSADAELVHRVLVLNDKNAYCDLVQTYQVEVRSYLQRLTKNQELANDLAQETFLLGYRRLDQLQEASKYRGWIFTIAHSRFLQWYRAKKDWVALDTVADAAAGGDPLARVEAHALLHQLRAEERSAVVLCLAHDFSHSEVAETLGMPVGTIKSLISRARERIGSVNEI